MLKRSVALVVGWALATGLQAQDLEQGRRWMQEGKSAEAIEVFTGLLRASPSNSDALLLRGLAYSRSGQWVLAVQDLEAATATSPNYADVWSALGNVYRWTDRPAAAADAYARLASLRPTDPEPQTLRARSLLAAGDLAGASLAAARARELGAEAASVQFVQSALELRTQASAPASSGYRWSGNLSAGRTTSELGRTHDRSVSVRHYTEAGSIALERLSVQRFGEQDIAWAVDAYPRLWSGAYANVRYQRAASPDWFPGHSWRAELYQSLGQGWEGAISHDRLAFSSSVKIDGLALAKYWGDFYARWRHQWVNTDSSSGQGDRLTFRYYYEGDADHYVELYRSRGRGLDQGETEVSNTGSDAYGLSWTHFVARNWGVKVSASRSRDSGVYGERERGLSAGLTFRW